MKSNTSIAWLNILYLAGSLCAGSASEYAIVVSQQTQSNADWRQVVDVLREKHQAKVITFDSSVTEALPKLRDQFPRYACFVAQPSEASREFVVKVHQLTRRLDEDPYTDCFWGILTGYDAANALRIAKHNEPLTIHKVASGTEIALDMCEEGVWWCELNKGKMVRKEKGREPKRIDSASDTTEALVRSLNDYKPGLFVTSGHATEHDWMIGFRYKNGFFKHENGRLYGLDTQGTKFPIDSPNPKVYLPIGNCLMGHIDRTDCMALSWMNGAGVNQMIGYTVPSWYGYAGWGCLDYFVEQPGRYTFTEAFFANQAALIHRLETYFPGDTTLEIDSNGRTLVPIKDSATARKAGLGIEDARGLLYDRDFVAFYGDPAWEARMGKVNCAWEQSLSEKNGVWTFEVKPNRGEKSFAAINKNGSQRGGRPIVEFLPKRIKNVQIVEGASFNPVIADNFILFPNPRECDPSKEYRIVFRANLAN